MALDLGRLVRVRVLRGADRDGKEKKGEMVVHGDDREGTIERVKEEARWWREVYVNAAYAPLTVHWSLEKGCVSEAWVGILGSVAGLVGFRELWKETA